MSYKPTPITARILKTTKGGVTQPILNMGAAVAQMKAPSVAKQTSGKLKPGEGVLKTPPKSTAGNFEPANPKNSNPVPFAFRQDNKIGGGSHSGVKGKMGSDTRKAEYDKRGWAYDETISKASVKKANPRPKVKAANTIKAKGVNAPEIENVFVADHNYKPDPAKGGKKKKAEPSKRDVRKANRKLDSADRKDSRAARVAQKAKEARASGNTAKADRLKRREARINKRAAKKRGQAASAIDVKKKTKKQSFNAVTDKAGYDAFQKAGGLTAWSKGKIKVK
jgi:hypothetical protein